MSESSGLGGVPMSDDAADTMFGTGVGQSAVAGEEDGQAVGAADRDADERESGAGNGPLAGGDGGDGDGSDGLFGGGLLDDERSAVEDGQPVGEADHEADVERSR